MKKLLWFVGKAVLTLSFVCLISSCSTTSGPTYLGGTDNNAPLFHDDRSVNAVLQFSSWDYTFLVRPQYSDGGYLQQVRRDNIGSVFNQLNVRRGTAVVIVGWTYNGEILDQVVSNWKTILGGCGFQRVVVVRAQWGNKIDGSVILDDSNLHLGSIESPARGG